MLKKLSRHTLTITKKRHNPRFACDNDFLQQIVAEIGARKDQIIKLDFHIFWQDKPHPRVYWYDPQQIRPKTSDKENITSMDTDQLSEQDLYPRLMQYLTSELKLYCQRIIKQEECVKKIGVNHHEYILEAYDSQQKNQEMEYLSR